MQIIHLQAKLFPGMKLMRFRREHKATKRSRSATYEQGCSLQAANEIEALRSRERTSTLKDVLCQPAWRIAD